MVQKTTLTIRIIPSYSFFFDLTPGTTTQRFPSRRQLVHCVPPLPTRSQRTFRDRQTEHANLERLTGPARLGLEDFILLRLSFQK